MSNFAVVFFETTFVRVEEVIYDNMSAVSWVDSW